MNIIGLRPSEIEALKAIDWTAEKKEELLVAIKRLVTNGVADGEMCFLSGKMLQRIGMEKTILSAEEVASVISDPFSPATTEFVEAFHIDFQRDIYTSLLKRYVAPPIEPVPVRMTLKELEDFMGHPIIIIG